MRNDIDDILATLKGPAKAALSAALPAALPAEPAVAAEAEAAAVAPDLRDSVTGLPDGRAFIEALRRALEADGRPGPAVIVLDVDGFRAVNYGFGWEEGDRLLREVARRLSATVREADLVSRLASDTFAVLLQRSEPREAEDVARRILDVLSASFELAGLEICPLACLGVATRAAGHARAEDVLRDAERALSRAKAFGRGRIEVFDTSLDTRALTLWQLEVALRRALDTEDFRAHYEPMVSMKGGQVAGFEVLLWRKSTVPAARAR